LLPLSQPARCCGSPGTAEEPVEAAGVVREQQQHQMLFISHSDTAGDVRNTAKQFTFTVPKNYFVLLNVGNLGILRLWSQCLKTLQSCARRGGGVTVRCCTELALLSCHPAPLSSAHFLYQS